ncbi:MAG: hypothetical protein GY796_19090 [Chloroflexi bacterium]|nr:hypothetical protein [Chloroflexota bacterium]
MTQIGKIDFGYEFKGSVQLQKKLPLQITNMTNERISRIFVGVIRVRPIPENNDPELMPFRELAGGFFKTGRII